MRFRNNITGDVLELPPPDALGASVVLFNGAEVESALYSDADGGSVTLGDGRRFHSIDDWVAYVIEQLRSGAYRRAASKEPEVKP
ncbi:MAG TPA: hypothetical protein VN442_14215 [Bryobacteraceae bacterium]|nr:hypothetical protein [Bryobacteraceae bacterium]